MTQDNLLSLSSKVVLDTYMHTCTYINTYIHTHTRVWVWVCARACYINESKKYECSEAIAFR